MPRALWSGSISFGLVNVPVKLFAAIHQQEVHFHMLHDKDGARIKQKRVCSEDGQEVPYDHVAKGYEVSPNHYVMITEEELGKLDPEATRSIDIEDFVSLEEIDPMYWEHTYHVVADKGAARAYGLLVSAMAKAGKVGIARVVLRTKQYLCTLRPVEKGLVLSTMLYADELVPQRSLDAPTPAAAAPKPRELEMAQMLIDSLTSKFEPAKYKDDYRERVLELIQAKAKGVELTAAPREKGKARAVDLMEALKASLAAPRQKVNEDAEAKGERRHHAKAARTRKAPRKKHA